MHGGWKANRIGNVRSKWSWAQELEEQNWSLFSSNITKHWSLNESKLLVTSSQILIPESLCGLMLEGEGRVLFFHNSLLHSNIRFPPCTSWVGGRGLCFKLKSISNDWPQCPEATWWQKGEERSTSSVFITVLRSLPLLKRGNTKRCLLASTGTNRGQEQKYWRMLGDARQAHVG